MGTPKRSPMWHAETARSRWHAAGATDAARSGRGDPHPTTRCPVPHGPRIVVRLSHAARSGRWCVRRSQAAVEAPPIQQSALPPSTCPNAVRTPRPPRPPHHPPPSYGFMA
eukprot:4136670-Prymnesium_polylepis.1